MSHNSITWFKTVKVTPHIYLTTEPYFAIGNRCNCWLIKGPAKDVLIDTGLGVQNIRKHLEEIQLVQPQSEYSLKSLENRECIAICTHVHFDHSGGAHHFQPNQVFIHEEDSQGLRNGRPTETLNYVKNSHFMQEPYSGFSATNYKVPATACNSVRDGDRIDLGGGEYLQILHTPGHTKGSICIYYSAQRALFSGDFVYECGSGVNLFDWLPTSCVREYLRSANNMLDFLNEDRVDLLYPGHFTVCKVNRAKQLLSEYIEMKDNCGSIACGSCVQCMTWGFFLIGCFRCCPC